MKIYRVLISLFIVSGGVSVSHAGVLVNHPPTHSDGPASDTEFIDVFGQPNSQLLADDFRLTSAAIARRITFWGFYSLDNLPVVERLRVRLYAARPDGLPGAVLSDEQVVNPPRTWTGRQIPVTIGPREFQYSIDLTLPYQLAPDIAYWLEISQMGDLNAAFHWEYSLADRNGFAFMNPSTIDWRLSTLAADLAFELSTVPEPASLGLCATGIGAMLVNWCRSRA